MGEKMSTAAAGIGAGFAATLGASVMQAMDMEAAGDKLAAQLGVGPAEAAELAGVSANVYKNAWGESADEVNLAIKGVYQNIGDTSAAEGGLEGVTTKALALSSTFDQDLTMSTAAVGQMIRTGLAKDANEAFDILAVGLGTAADKSGDLLETFNEYSVQFKRVGLDGKTATGLIAQGLQGGARDADQVADALGQFGERALAGGTAVDAAYKSIGLNAGDMAKKIGAGGTTAAGALTETLDALRGTKDEQVKLNAAAQLFGDPANVMGDALYALDPASAVAATGMDKTSGAMDKLADTASGNPTMALEKFKRTVLVDLGQAGGTIAQFAMQHTGVTKGLALALGGVVTVVLLVAAAQKVYAAYTAISTAATNLMNSATYRAIAGWTRMMAVGLATYVRIAAGAVASAATTAAAWVGSALVSIGTWIAAVVRAGITAAAQFLMMAARAVAWAAVMAAQWLIAMGPIGWIIAAVIALVVLIIANWDKVKAFTVAAWNWIWAKIKAFAGFIWKLFLNWTIAGLIIKHWDKIKSGVTSKTTTLLSFIRGIPGKVKGYFGNLGHLLLNAGKSIITGLINGVKSQIGNLKSQFSNITGMIPDWKGPMSLDLRLLTPSGAALMSGLMTGIDGQLPALHTQLTGVTSSIAGDVDTGLTGARLPAPAPLATGSGGGQTVRLIVEVTGPQEVRRLIRSIVRKDGGGSVQAAFGGTP